MDVEVVEVEYVEFGHDGVGMCSWWLIGDESNDLFVGSDQRLYVCFSSVVCAPYRDVSNEMWEDLTIV